MSSYRLLREYLRACLRLQQQPDERSRKRVVQLRFLGAHLCPACGEEVKAGSYRVVTAEDGSRIESYRCDGCGCDYSFPRRSIQ